MRIGYYQRQIDLGVSQSANTRGATTSKEAAAKTAATAEAVRVNVSSEAKAMAASSQGVDEAKVERLRAAMAKGEIKPNATAIAKGLLKEQGYESDEDAGSN